MNASTDLARSCVRELIDAGVTEVVLAPGSRNAPLAFAVYDADRAGLLRLHTRIDERTAGFLALGLTKAGRRAAVVCTSGTAVANLFPAVMEAAHAGLALVVVTADRPASLRGTGASQTTDQVEVFGRFAQFADVATVDDLEGPAWALARLPDAHAFTPSSVLHLNVQFSLPLTPDDSWVAGGGDSAVARSKRAYEERRSAAREALGDEEFGRREATSTRPSVLSAGPRTVVVAGDDAGSEARKVAEGGGWPLLAEPTSGARTGSHALRTYRLLLDGALGKQIERVVVVGHPTLSRPVTRLLERDHVEIVAVTHPGIWSERPFRVDVEADRGTLVAEKQDDPSWLDAWRELDRSTGRHLDVLLRDRPELTPHEAVGAVAAAVPPGGLLVVGASSPIRDLDLMSRPTPVGQRRKVIANRGLAGIDGTISTAIGAALARPAESRSLALMGDVTFLHDAGALVIGPEEPRPDLTIVVVNDDGGSIFTMLEQGAPAYAEQYDRLFGTPHGVDIASLCASTRTPHWRVESLPELQQALASPNGGIEVIEVRVRRDNRRELDAAIRALPDRHQETGSI